MRPQTQQAIDKLFEEDHEYATRVAHHVVNTESNPPQWALDIVGPKKGWKHPAGEYSH